MNAADVLAEARFRGMGGLTEAEHCDALVDALLAHGEQGVAILPDGTLWALEWRAHEGADGELADASRLTMFNVVTGEVANPHWHTLYRLVPLSAEAGDTDG